LRAVSAATAAIAAAGVTTGVVAGVTGVASAIPDAENELAANADQLRAARKRKSSVLIRRLKQLKVMFPGLTAAWQIIDVDTFAGDVPLHAIEELAHRARRLFKALNAFIEHVLDHVMCSDRYDTISKRNS
jgi:hypothetical protein